MTSSSKASVFSLAYHHHFVKFAIVGAIGIVVNEGLLILIKSGGVYYLDAGAVAIEVSILSNFVLNDLWTFRDRRSGHTVFRLVKFNALMFAGLALNLAVLYAGVDYFGMTPEIANLVGIAVAFFLRYGLSVRYAWMRIESTEEGRAAPIPQPLTGSQTA
ncbi:MAG TPA: GtrA family protein [Spirochaetia bacterium]|nr:GtrA family protein [Spirochaetia bacterium]